MRKKTVSPLKKLEELDVFRVRARSCSTALRTRRGVRWGAGIIGALACMVATGAYADAEPVRGRVAGMYYTLTTRTPQFPFLALW